MRKLVVRWMWFACCAALATSCSKGSRSAARTARAAATGVPGAPAQLVADLHAGSAPVGSSPHGFVVSGATAFFAADDGSSGYELWATQGLAGDPVLVQDVRPGGGSSLPANDPIEGVAWNGGLLFAADDGSRGTELWFSDGTAAGTNLLKDLEPGTGSSNPRHFAVAGNRVFFAATTSATGEELWTTDGTPGGTSRVLDIGQGFGGIDPTASSAPQELTAVGSTLFFTADDGTTGRELWKSDGTPGGTQLVLDISAGSDTPTNLTALGSLLYFVDADTVTANRVLWASDGTPGGTQPLGADGTRPVDPALLTTLGTSLFFVAGPPGARDVWEWNGASFQPRTQAPATPSGAAALVASGGGLYASLCPAGVSPCTAADLALYRWTPQGGGFLSPLRTPGGLPISNPSLLTDVAGTLHCAAPGSGALTLWRTNGTTAGTEQIQPTLRVDVIAAFGGRALVSGQGELSANGAEPWIVDAGSPTALRNIHPDTGASNPRALTVQDGQLFFSADDGLNGRQLWVVDPSLVATLIIDTLVNVGNASGVADLVDAGSGLLLFTATDSAHGRELRAYPNATLDPDFLLTDLFPGTTSGLSSPGAWLTRLGGNVLFVADDGSGHGRELWRTDGTAAGTALVQDVYPGAASSSPERLVAIGPNVWFVAQDGGAGGGTAQAKAFRTDGAAAVPVQDFAGDFVVNPTWFAPLSTNVAFGAESALTGRAVFVWDSGTQVVRALTAFGAPSTGTADPVGFTTLGTAGYFGVRDSTNRGYALWKTDGFNAGTTRVQGVGTLGGGRFSSPVSFGGRLWFVGNDDVNGDELWTSDGTTAGTRRVLDVLQGPGSALDGSVLFPLPARGRVLFAADDGVNGRELWISDGTAAGTRLLHDIWPGPGSSNPADFTALGELVFFTADDGSRGRELWVIDTSAANLDLTPPVPVCPAGITTYEATGPSGADPAFAISATDNSGLAVTVTFSRPAGGTWPLNQLSQVTAFATDASGNKAQCSFTITVQDHTSPTLTCPASFSVEARSAAGADATFSGTTAAVATDVVDPSPTIQYAPASGSTFALGPSKAPLTTPVTATAFDASGNSTTCAFGVTVRDTTPPSLTCPADVTVEATGPAGASASWGDAAATDAVSPAGSISIAYGAPRPSTFPLGESPVQATATDEAGNARTCAFKVTVQDTTPPLVFCPSGLVTAEATTFTGGPASFAATGTDAVRLAPGVVYDPAPLGTWATGQVVTTFLPYGVTTVTAWAWDGFNRSAVPCQFPVRVQDTTPPGVTCPAPLLLRATRPDGAPLPLAGLASATDAATAAPAVDYAAFGDTVSATAWIAPLGLTTVTATATDRGGNTSACAFDVAVVDTLAPTVTCPASFTVDAASAAGALVSFASTTAATATDAVTLAPALGYTPASGALFPVGAGGAPLSTTVDVTATDGAGNSSACAFQVTVADLRPPVATCPADQEYEANAPGGITLLAFTDASFLVTDATGADAVTPSARMTRANGLVTYSPGLGSAFPVGTTLVTARVADDAGNAATCTFQVRVKDTTPPRLSCPASVPPVEATGNGQAAVSFDVSAVDSVTVHPVLSFDTGSGQAFPLGTTTVHVTATDDAGNQATCQFPVTVVDTTPPSIVCPADRTVPGKGGVPVRFPAPTVYDAGTPAPALTATHRSGDAFPVGVTRVTFTATDTSGNAASCAMSVTVHPTPFEAGAGGCATGSGGAVALLGLGAALLRRRGMRRRT